MNDKVRALGAVAVLFAIATALGPVCPVMAQQAATDLYDRPTAVQKLPPPSPAEPYEIHCTYFPDLMIRERQDGPASENAAIVPGSRPACGSQKMAGEIALNTAGKYFIGRKGSFLLFSELSPHGAANFAVFDAKTGRSIFADASAADPQFEVVSLEKGMLRLRYKRGINASCSIMADARGCWRQLVAAGKIPAAMARLVPSSRICEEPYRANNNAPADASSIVMYNVDARIGTWGTTRVAPRGAVSCGVVP